LIRVGLGFFCKVLTLRLIPRLANSLCKIKIKKKRKEEGDLVGENHVLIAVGGVKAENYN